MNYGSIAYLNNGKLFIPEYLLRPFNIDNNTSLTLLSYTTPDSKKQVEEIKRLGYRNMPEKHDILITPIPFRLWPFLIRVKILLQERDGAIASLTNYFHEKKLNILTADCHRAGFRYMVYSCFLECTELRQKYDIIGQRVSQNIHPFITYESDDPNKLTWMSLEVEMNKKVKDLIKDLKPLRENEINDNTLSKFNPKNDKTKEVKRFLLITTQKEYNEGMVSEIKKSSTLPYHFLKVSTGNSQKNRIPHYEKYINGNIKLPESLLLEFNRNHKMDLLDKKLSPSFGFVNVDTNSPRIRVTLTPKYEVSKYRRVIIDYRRDSLLSNSSETNRAQSNSSMGLIAVLSEILTDEFKLKLENVVNRIWQNKRKVELGKVEIIAEKTEESRFTWTDIEERLKYVLSEEKKEFNHTETNVRCTPINPFLFFVSLKSKDEKFVSNTKKMLFEAGKHLGIEESDFRFVWTHSTPVTESVITALRECNALVQIYHSTSLEKDEFSWLDGEFLAMRALNKPCARICSDKRYFENGFSKFDKDVMPYVINFSHGDEIVIEKYKSLLDELIMRIEDDEPNILNRFR